MADIIANWRAIFSKLEISNPDTSTYPPTKCPTYSEAIACNGVGVSGSYATNQLVKLDNVYLNRYITGYGDLNLDNVSISCSDIAASGGTISSGTISGTIYQTIYYNIKGNETASYAAPSYVYWSGGASGSNLSTTPTSRTAKGTLYANFTINGKSGSKSTTVYQAANVATYHSYTGSYWCSVSPTSINASASSGTYTVVPSAGHTLYYYYTYTSGAQSSTSSSSVVDGTGLSSISSWMAFSGTTLTVSTNTGAARAGSIVFYNTSNSSYTASASVSQAAGVLAKCTISVEFSEQFFGGYKPTAFIADVAPTSNLSIDCLVMYTNSTSTYYWDGSATLPAGSTRVTCSFDGLTILDKPTSGIILQGTITPSSDSTYKYAFKAA